MHKKRYLTSHSEEGHAFTAQASCNAAFAASTIRRNTANASEGSWCLNRSSLLTIKSGFNRSAQAARKHLESGRARPRRRPQQLNNHQTTYKRHKHHACAKSAWPGCR